MDTYQQVLNPPLAVQKSPTYAELEAVVKRYLLIADEGLIRVIVACILANRSLADPVWLLIVAASGGAKTELLRGINGVEGVYPISDLTPQTFLSGQIKNPNGSLLNRLPPNAIITMKDFTSVLSMNSDKRGAILAQLREIYDGYIGKEFGTGESITWQGKLGFIAGVTSVIDRHQMVFQTLGERFIQYRPTQPDPIKLATRAISNNGNEVAMREEIQAAFTSYIESVPIPTEPVSPPEIYTEKIIRLAVFCTKARSGIVRESKTSREILLVPEPEQPTRLAKQLINVFNGLALISGDYTEDDYRLVYKVGMDSLPTIRDRILKQLAKATAPCTVNDVASAIGYPRNTAARQLEELECLSLIKANTNKQPYGYELLDYTKGLLTKAKPKVTRK